MFCYCMNSKANGKLTGQIILKFSQNLYNSGQNKCTNVTIFKNNSELSPKDAHLFKILYCTYFQDMAVGPIQFCNLQFEGLGSHYHIAWVFRQSKCCNWFRGRVQVVLEKKRMFATPFSRSLPSINRLTDSNKLCTKTFKLASCCEP